MSLSSSTVRALFDSQVFQHATVQAFTDKIFGYDILSLNSTDATELYYASKLNFITFVCLRSIDYDATQMNSNPNDYGYKYEILINYYLEADSNALAYNQVIDRLELIDDLILSELGLRWDGNIDNSRQQDISLPEITEIEDVECWNASLLWSGLKYN